MIPVERFLITPGAKQDLAEAFRWYEERSEGLGNDFLQEVDSCFDSIRSFPESFERVLDEYRRAIVSRFPYLVFFECNANSITVYAVFHSAMNPMRWRQRLPIA